MKLSRFDKLVFLTLAGLLVTTGLLARQAERQGVQIVTRSPAPGAEDASTRSTIRVTFDQSMDIARFGAQSGSALPLPLVIQPPVSGTVRWSKNSCIFTPSAPLAPETLYTVTLPKTVRSLQGRSLQEDVQWRFRTRKPALLYLAPDSDGIIQINTIDPDTRLAQRLSQAASDVRDYALSPDAATIIYTVSNEQQGSDLWSVDLATHKHSRLLKCQQELCASPVWFPDGTRLMYERKQGEHEMSRLWWFDLKSGDSLPVFDDAGQSGFGAACSPDGAWLSYLDPQRQELRLFHLNDGRQFSIPNQMETPPVWHPQKNLLLFSDVLFQGEEMLSHLFLVDPERGELQDLSGELSVVEDRVPAWSSDGKWIAFSRKMSGTRMGRQLGFMQADGTDPFPLTENAAYTHTLPVWSPDDRYLTFQRSSLEDPASPPEIWVLDVLNGQRRKVVTPGMQPAWLP